MGEFGYPDLKIELDAADTLLKDISKFVTTINGWSKERLIEELTGAGDTTDRWGDIGFTQKTEVELTGPYDDTTNGLVAIAKAWTDGSLRTLKLTFDMPTASDIQTVEVLQARVQRNPARGALHQFIVTLRPTGAIT